MMHEGARQLLLAGAGLFLIGALIMAYNLFMTIASPFLKFMTASTRAVLKLFGTHQMREVGVHSPDELKLIVSASRRLGPARG